MNSGCLKKIPCLNKSKTERILCDSSKSSNSQIIWPDLLVPEFIWILFCLVLGQYMALRRLICVISTKHTALPAFCWTAPVRCPADEVKHMGGSLFTVSVSGPKLWNALLEPICLRLNQTLRPTYFRWHIWHWTGHYLFILYSLTRF